MAVLNTLDSDSITDSLSANMGRELNERLSLVEFDVSDISSNITNIDERVATLEESPSSDNCETRIWTQAN